MRKKINKGMSLVEILVVITIFAIIGILMTRSLFLTLRGAKKSDSLVRVRENVNNALSVIERQLRNAESIDCSSSTSSVISYISVEGINASFACSGSFISSDSARLTSTDITLTSCVFTCTETTDKAPQVKINLTAEDNLTTSVEKGFVSVQTEITARNY